MLNEKHQISDNKEKNRKILSATQYERKTVTARHVAILSISMTLNSTVPLPAILNSFFNAPSFLRPEDPDNADQAKTLVQFQKNKSLRLKSKSAAIQNHMDSRFSNVELSATEKNKKESASYAKLEKGAESKSDVKKAIQESLKNQFKEKYVHRFDLKESCAPPVSSQNFSHPAHIARLSSSSYYAPYIKPHLQSDKAFCTALVYGYFRHAGFLRFVLHEYIKKPAKLPLPCLYALYLGIFEIIFKDFKSNSLSKRKDSTHAVLYEYVEIIKGEYGQKLADLVNAVLRNVVREKDAILEKVNTAKLAIYDDYSSNKMPSKKSLRFMHSLADLSSLFTDEVSRTFTQYIARENFYIPVPVYRINTRYQGLTNNTEDIFDLFTLYDLTCLYYIEPDDFETSSPIEQLVTQFTDYRYPPTPNELNRHVIFSYVKNWEKMGLLTRQGIASQIISKKIANFLKDEFDGNHHGEFCESNPWVKENFRLWDACCGRGGKSSSLIEMDIPVFLCTDPNTERLNYAMENLERLGLLPEDVRRKDIKVRENCDVSTCKIAIENDGRCCLVDAANATENGSKRPIRSCHPHSCNCYYECYENNPPHFKVSTAQEIVEQIIFNRKFAKVERDATSDPNKKEVERIHFEERTPEEFEALTSMEKRLVRKEKQAWENMTDDFSCILVDAPCTASGTIGRNPEVKYRITPATLENSLQTQREILDSTWQVLQKGGYLFYITCSLFKKENEAQVVDFIKTRDATLIELDYILPHQINEDFKGHDSLFYAIIQKKISD